MTMFILAQPQTESQGVGGSASSIYAWIIRSNIFSHYIIRNKTLPQYSTIPSYTVDTPSTNSLSHIDDTYGKFHHSYGSDVDTSLSEELHWPSLASMTHCWVVHSFCQIRQWRVNLTYGQCQSRNISKDSISNDSNNNGNHWCQTKSAK